MPLQLLQPEDEDNESQRPSGQQDESREPVRIDSDEEEGGREEASEGYAGDEESEESSQEVERPSRRDTATENRELRERLARLEGQLTQTRAQAPPQPAPREPSDDEKATWTTQQHIQYELSRAEARNQQTLSQIQFQTLEAGDKAGWASYCATDPRARKLTNDVEARLTQLRQAGQWGWSRGDVYTRLVGERAIAQGRKAAETQRQEGAKRIARQTTRGASPAGDQRKNDRGNLTPQQERDKRLKDAGFFG